MIDTVSFEDVPLCSRFEWVFWFALVLLCFHHFPVGFHETTQEFGMVFALWFIPSDTFFGSHLIMMGWTRLWSWYNNRGILLTQGMVPFGGVGGGEGGAMGQPQLSQLYRIET